MGKKWSTEDVSAYEALDRLLFSEWDPIGICAMNGPKDEYTSYLPEFWRLVNEPGAAEMATGYLHDVEVNRIGIETSAEHRLDIVSKALVLITAWRTTVRT